MSQCSSDLLTNIYNFILIDFIPILKKLKKFSWTPMLKFQAEITGMLLF